MRKSMYFLIGIIFLFAQPLAIHAQSTNAGSRVYIEVSSGTSLNSVDSLIDIYTEYRADSLRPAEKAILQSSKQLSKYSIPADTIFSGSIIADEQRRKTLIKDMENRLDLIIVDASSETQIINRIEKDPYTILDCYVITYFYYKDVSQAENPDAPIDKSGFGTYHTLTFEKGVNGTIQLLTDEYDEGHLTNMRSSSYKAIEKDTEIQTFSQSYNELGPGQSQLTSAAAGIGQYDNFSYWYEDHAITYYVMEGIAYSDKYALSYNPAYSNLNTSGGDCVNFASQCFDAATRQQCRNNSFKPYTAAWISSTSSINYWGSGNRGFRIACTPSKNYVSSGQFVYYDWDNKGGGNVFYHTAYCVGTDSSGVPIVNSHNKDYYHVRWNYGGANCTYATCIIRG